MRRFELLVSPLALACLLGLPSAALAATATPAARAEMLTHRVQLGDTLSSLAEHYLASASRWVELQRANGVADPRRLVVGSIVRIPVQALPWLPAPALITRLQGEVTIQRGGSREPVALGLGDAVNEGDVVRLGRDSFAAVRMVDGSVVRLLGETEVRMSQLRHQQATDAMRTMLDVQRGRITSDVMPVQSPGRFDVRTPLAVAGVRGTRFGVAVRNGRTTAIDVLEGKVLVGTAGKARPDGVATLPGEAAVVSGDGIVARRVLLPAPDLSSFAATQERPVVTFSPPAVSGAVQYEVEVATDERMRDVVERHETEGGQAVAFSGLSDGRYFLGARAVDPDGIAGAQAVAHFELHAWPPPPILQSPANQEQVSGTSLELTCAEPLGAQAYWLQLADDASFATPRAEQRSLPQCRWQPGELPPGRYYWRAASVAASQSKRGEMVTGPFGSVGEFVVPSFPTAPSLPSASSNADGSVALQWAGGATRFEVETAEDAAFSTGLQVTEVDRSEARIPLRPCADHFVRVRAVDALGRRSGYSAVQRIVSSQVCDSQQRPVFDGSRTPLRIR